MYHYSLTSTGDSSAKYGPCEVCGEHASEVFIQAEMQEVEGLKGFTFYACRPHSFGHKACLESIQR